ncbi:NU4M oxidoreductase, partial [Acromyrmex heyeri]
MILFFFWRFLMIYIAFFFIKMPVYFMFGVLLKMGEYGLIRLIEVYYKILVQIDIKSIDIKSIAYTSVVHINLILCRLMTFFKVEILRGRGDVIIISHGLRSSGIFYVVNLYYERSRRRLLFLNKGIISNLPTVIIL